jgi:hypothetical protein
MTSFKIADSESVIPASLELFDKGSTEVAVTRVSYLDLVPIGPIGNATGPNGGPIEFIIPKEGLQYTDLQRTLLHIRIRVLNNITGKPITSENKVGLINGVLNSLFSQVQVTFKDKLVSNGEVHHNLTSYLLDLLGSSVEAKNSHMSAAGFYLDVNIGERNPLGSNLGLNRRTGLIADGKEADFIGRIRSDALDLDRFLLPGVQVTIKLWPAASNFILITDEETANYSIEITHACLKVCKITVASTITMNHEKTLDEGKDALYPFTRHSIQLFTIQKENLTFSHSNIFGEDIPFILIIGLVKSSSMIGSYTDNPYTFLPYNLANIRILLDQENVFGGPLDLSFNNETGDLYIQAVSNMFTGLGLDDPDFGNGIDRHTFKGGHNLYVFRLIPSTEGLESFPLIKKSSLLIEGRFNKPNPDNLSLICFGLFSSMVTIDKARNVML